MNIQNPNTACEHGHQRRKCPYCELSFLLEELLKQRDAALKLADLWEVQAIKYPLENATSLVSPYTAEAVAVGQAAVRACANELRAIFEPKE